MALDAGPLAQHAAYVIDQVVADYGDTVELIDAVIALELNDPEDDVSIVVAYSMSKRNVTATGILARALYAVVNPDG